MATEQMIQNEQCFLFSLIENVTGLRSEKTYLIYVDANFDHIFRVLSLITFLWTWYSFKIFNNYVLITGRSAVIYRIVIAYSEKEIHTIKI